MIIIVHTHTHRENNYIYTPWLSIRRQQQQLIMVMKTKWICSLPKDGVCIATNRGRGSAGGNLQFMRVHCIIIRYLHAQNIVKLLGAPEIETRRLARLQTRRCLEKRCCNVYTSTLYIFKSVCVCICVLKLDVRYTL